MTPVPAPVETSRPVLPWLVTVLVIVLAAGGFFWMDRKIETLQAAAHQDSGIEDARQAVAGLQQSTKDVQSSQQKLGEQINDLERKLASEAEERKLMSDQLGALSARVDALASANAQSTPSAPQAQTNRRNRR
jgi:septal ring factor EnvC (AmiA/AmiB activator)